MLYKHVECLLCGVRVGPHYSWSNVLIIVLGDEMTIGYVRVSSLDQNEERQLVPMKKHEVENIFIV